MEQKIILITGASSGIGKCAAEALLRKGHLVYAAARRVERMSDLEKAGAILLKMDVTDEKSVAEGVSRVLSEQGRIDVLVNNAGYGYFGALETVPLEEARAQFDVNVFGLASLCQAVLPQMRAQGGGRIVNVASMAGHFCEPRGGWYHASKYSVVALSECMRMEVKPFGVKVMLVEPGMIRSSWCDIAMDNLEACSAGTVYGSGAARHSKVFRWAYARFATKPEVIADAIAKASTSRRPRLHYRRGMGSTLLPVLSKILPSRCFDNILLSIFGK